MRNYKYIEKFPVNSIDSKLFPFRLQTSKGKKCLESSDINLPIRDDKVIEYLQSVTGKGSTEWFFNYYYRKKDLLTGS